MSQFTAARIIDTIPSHLTVVCRNHPQYGLECFVAGINPDASFPVCIGMDHISAKVFWKLFRHVCRDITHMQNSI